MASSSEELSTQADQLMETIAFFHIERSEVSNRKSVYSHTPQNAVRRNQSQAQPDAAKKVSNGLVLNMGTDVRDEDYQQY